MVKKASKLAVAELLEFVAVKGMNTAGMEEPKSNATPADDGDNADLASSSSSSSAHGRSTPKQDELPAQPKKQVTADVAEALSRDEEDSQLPEDDM